MSVVVMNVFGIVKGICSMPLFVHPQLNPMQGKHTHSVHKNVCVHTHRITVLLSGKQQEFHWRIFNLTQR